MKSFFFIGIFFVFALAAQEKTTEENTKETPDVRQEAQKEAERKDQNIRQVIAYGIDSELVAVIQNLRREAPQADDGENILWLEETPYNSAIYKRIEKGYSSSELQTEAIRFFMQQKWLGAQEYVDSVIATERSDSNLLLAALAYVRNLKVRSSEESIMDLLASDNPLVVEQSMITLGKIGTTTSAAEILKLLEENAFPKFPNDREREVLRVAGISAMGDLSYSAAVAYLFGILEDAGEAEPQYSNVEWGAAAAALGQMKQTEAAELVLERFRNGNTQERYQAIQALASFPWQGKFEAVILQGLQEAYWKTRQKAAVAAGELKLHSAIPSLAYKVARDSVAGVRRSAIQALRQLGAGATLQELMQDPEIGEAQRLDVLRTLVRARAESAVQIFRQLLDEQDNKLSRSGMFQVASKNPWAALDFVYKEMLSARDRKTRQDALRSIARERIESLQGEVEKLAENSADSVIIRAAKATLVILDS